MAESMSNIEAHGGMPRLAPGIRAILQQLVSKDGDIITAQIQF